MKNWKIGKLRPITILIGLRAYEWELKIRRKHSTSLPEDWSDHPSQVLEYTYSHCLMVKNTGRPWVIVTNCLEAIYAFNNCIHAFPLGDAEIPGIVKPEFRLDPKNVIAYQCDSETEKPVCISDPETGWIDERPLRQYVEQLQAEFNRILAALCRDLEALNKTKPPRVKNISKRAPRIKDTSKSAPKLDHDKIAAGLGAKRVGKSPKRSTRGVPVQPPRKAPKS
jgi:hypothetical protein